MTYKKEGNSSKKSKKGSKLLVILLAVLAVIAIVAIVGGLYIKGEFDGKHAAASGSLTVEIMEGSSTEAVGTTLKENGLIGNVMLFKTYSRMNKADGTFQFGKHEFTAGMTYAQIVEVLQQKTFAEFESFTVTFPEGTTALSMAMTFEKNGVCTVDEFIDACNNHTFDVSFFGEISASPDKFIKLDGFLFPDTYEFAVGAKIDDIILKMLKNFETKVLTPETLELIKSSGMSLEENIILASIVQKESLGGDVYGKVSSIFHNRLKNKEEFPHIESDTSAAHLEYGFIYGVLGLYYNGDIEPMERNIPQNMVAAYDTYTHEGLIVGAICNPGLSAIKGTLLPEDTDYYFFITDVNKKFYWGKTAADHDANIKEVSRVNDAAANAPT